MGSNIIKLILQFSMIFLGYRPIGNHKKYTSSPKRLCCVDFYRIRGTNERAILERINSPLANINVKRYILILLVIHPKLVFLSWQKINGILNFTLLLQMSIMVPLPPFHLPCLAMPSTPPPCLNNVLWLPTTLEVSWQLTESHRERQI